MSELDRPDVVAEVRSRSDIVEIIGEYVELKRTGSNYVGLCPFHNERGPSFNVSPKRHLFYCFGCHVKGSVFDFLMMIEGITFNEALSRLAERAGVKLPDHLGGHDDALDEQRKLLYAVYNKATKYYRAALVMQKGSEADEARKYLIDRRIVADDVKNFYLGFASDTRSGLADFLISKGFTPDIITSSGLCRTDQSGRGVYDVFRNRIIFPILDDRGRVVAFGGRILDGSHPKYLNSAESIIFNKSKCLYGLRQARESIRKESRAVLVEGYMDVIACHRAGLTTAVASLGTSFTREQAVLLSRLASEVIIAYDSDTAGVSATLKAFELLIEVGLKVKVASMAPAKDPDELVSLRGANELHRAIDSAISIISFRLRHILGECDITTPEGRVSAVNMIVPLLSKFNNAVELSEYTKVVSGAIGVSTEALSEEIRRVQRRSGVISTKTDTGTVVRNTNIKTFPASATKSVMPRIQGLPTAVSTAERELLRLIIHDEDYLRVTYNSLGAAAFRVAAYRRIAEVLFNEFEQYGTISDIGLLQNKLDDETAKKIFARLIIEPSSAEDKERLFLDYANKIREYQLREDIKQLGIQAAALDEQGRFEDSKECLRKCQELRERLEREFLSPH